MMRRLAASLITLLPALAAETPGIIQVTDLRTWSHGASTRVVLQMSGPFAFRSESATDPDRLFFDIAKARPWIAHKRYSTRQVNDALLRRVRVTESSPGKTRVVFDLTGPAAYSVSRLSAPDRMVIEVRRKPGSPVAKLGKVRKPFVYPPVVRPVARRVVLASEPPPLEPIMPLARVTLIPDSFKPVTTRRYTPPPPTPAQIAASTRVLVPQRPATPVYTGSARVSEDATSSLTRALGLKVNRIVIDAGHGGHDEGTSGPNGLLEKDVVLDVAQRVAKLVQTRMAIEVVLTRSDDTFIPLTERTSIANHKRADLFLTIHANSSPAPAVSGIETFFLNFSNSPGALDVAARENAGSDKSVAELQDLVKTITMNDKITESQNFAQTVQSSLYSQALKGNPAAHNRGVKRAPFVVLIGAQMP
ncbi:MAG TPA: N-acetylmuramoyl-L-alanine amidase, partial [Bryobacteraceae bacterium]|nr:N-acetylmuramoyl-L-alanine amidase [Bryobacteraceae bacterium]